MADNMKHIMISYQWDAQPRMITLRDHLLRAGYDVWMDVDQMEGDMYDRMAEAVEQASVVLMCFSKKYQESANCKREAQYASKRQKQLVPLKYEDYEPSGWLGLMISQLLYYDVRTDEAMTEHLPNIIRAFDKRGVSRRSEGRVESAKSSSEASEPPMTTCHRQPVESGFSIIKREDVVMGEILGGGGFGTVYLAGHKHWGDVAVKQFRTLVSEDVRREAEKMLRAISSPFLVRIMGIIDEPQCLSIVMEYFENGNLKDFRQRFMHSDVCLPRKIRMIQDMALGVNYLHTLTPPIIHRDIKLSNIFVGNGFEAKIGDLGLAINKKSTASQGSDDVTAGTCTHLPPEAWAKTQTVPKEAFDIYTFGITLQEFLSGQDPWPPSATPSMISLWVQGDQRPDPSSIPDATPPEIVSIMNACCSLRPADRPPFQEIQKRVSTLYADKFKGGIRTADQTIIAEMSKVEQASSSSINPKSSLSTTTTQGADSGSSPQPQAPAAPNRARAMGRHTVDASLSDSGIGISASDHSHQAHAPQAINLLRKTREFGKEGTGPGDFGRARGIAVSPNTGDIVVADPTKKSVLVFAQEGRYKYTVTSPDGDPEGQLRTPHDVAISGDDCLMVVDQTKFVKIFDAADGTYVKSFATMTKYDAEKKVGTCCVTVDIQGQIIVGNYHRKLITIHDAMDGSIQSKLTVNIEPYFLATNTKQQIIIGDLKARKVVVIDYNGKEVLIINPLLAGTPCIPMGVACDGSDNIFVAVVKEDASGKGTMDSGCILQYNSAGLFMACVARDLCYPMGMTFSRESELFVANHETVMAFSAN